LVLSSPITLIYSLSLHDALPIYDKTIYDATLGEQTTDNASSFILLIARLMIIVIIINRYKQTNTTVIIMIKCCKYDTDNFAFFINDRTSTISSVNWCLNH